MNKSELVFGGSSASMVIGSCTGVVVHNDGVEWTVLRNDFAVIMTTVWGSGPGDVFFGGENGTVLHFDGATYTPISGATGAIATIIGDGGTDDVLVFDSDDNWYRYDRTGTTLALSGHLSGVRSVWGTSLSNLFAACGTRGIYHYDGGDWTTETLPAGVEVYDWRAIWGTSEGVLFAGGYGAAGWDSAGILRRTHGQWINDSGLLTPNEFRDVWAIPTTLAYAAGDGGTLARWDGKAWTLVDLGTTKSLSGFWPPQPTTSWCLLGQIPSTMPKNRIATIGLEPIGRSLGSTECGNRRSSTSRSYPLYYLGRRHQIRNRRTHLLRSPSSGDRTSAKLSHIPIRSTSVPRGHSNSLGPSG